MLEILDHWGADGLSEIEIQFGDRAGDYDFGNTEQGESRAFWTLRLVVASVIRSLIKKGLVIDGEDGYWISESGRAILDRKINT